MDIESWAREHGLLVVTPADFGSAPATDPRVDFGCSFVRTPRCVVRPRTVAELSDCLRALADADLPYRLRGAGYSAGGQVLSEGGAVVDLSRLSGVVADDPERQEVTVLGGTSWLVVGNELRKTGRRPLVSAENLNMTVGGLLAVGGIGDTTTVHGLAIQSVIRLVVVTPDGSPREVGRDDRLFGAVLGGSGLLGAVAQVTLRTVSRPATMVLRTATWATLDDLLADAAANADQRMNELFIGGIRSAGGQPTFVGTFGNFAVVPESDDPSLHDLRAHVVQPPQIVDRFEALRQQTYSWGAPRPSMQVVVPLPAGRELARTLPGSVVDRVGLVLFRRAEGFPMAPLPAGTHLLGILIRAELGEPRVPDELLATLRQIGERALELGGRIIMTSVHAPELAQQLGDEAAAELLALRRELDPQDLCNRGLFSTLGQR